MCLILSSQKVKLCEGGGEAAGEEGEEAPSAAGAQGEESTGTWLQLTRGLYVNNPEHGSKPIKDNVVKSSSLLQFVQDRVEK